MSRANGVARARERANDGGPMFSDVTMPEFTPPFARMRHVADRGEAAVGAPARLAVRPLPGIVAPHDTAVSRRRPGTATYLTWAAF